MPDPTERACRACGSSFLASRRGTRGGSLSVYCSDECRSGVARARSCRHYTPAPLVEKECRWCFSAFTGKGHSAYCSGECKRLVHNHRAEHRHQDCCDVPWGECPGCGRLCVQYHNRRFCSRRCRERSRGPRRRQHRHGCETCGGEFFSGGTARRYCSDACRAFRGSPSSRVPWAECPWCGRWFVRRGNRKYCSKLCLDANHPCRSKVTEIGYGECRRCGLTFVRRIGHLGKFCSARCSARARKNQRMHLLRASASGELFTLREVAERDGWRCHLCRQKVPDREYRARDRDPTLDHLIPVSAGGAHTLDNVALAHNRCNWERSTAGEVQLRLVG